MVAKKTPSTSKAKTPKTKKTPSTSKAKAPKTKKTSAKKTEENNELLKFPCDFPIKVVGRVGEDFETSMMTIVRQHFPNVKPSDCVSRLSREANYISLTITVHAENRAQLDSTYEELSASPKVIMAL